MGAIENRGAFCKPIDVRSFDDGIPWNCGSEELEEGVQVESGFRRLVRSLIDEPVKLGGNGLCR